MLAVNLRYERSVLATLQSGTSDEVQAALKAATKLVVEEIVELSALAKTHGDAKLRKLAKQTLDQHAPAASAALAATIKSLARDDSKVTKQLRALEAIGDFPDVPALAAALVARTSDHMGLAYLCEHGGPIAKRALQASVDEHGTLDLAGIKRIPDELGELGNLRSLALRGCGLKAIPEPVLKLRGLRSLDLSKNRFVVLPDEIEQLVELEVLVLHDVPLTRGLGRGLVRLPKLRELWIIRGNFKELPDDLGELAGSLESLRIVQCSKLTSVPASIGKLARLRHLELDHCDSLASVPDAIWSLRSLERLDLSGMKLGRLPESLGELRALCELQLRGCEVELPESFGQLASLATLDLVFGRIRDLPASFYTLPALARLRIEYSPLEKSHTRQIVSRMPNVKIFK
jgi:Leucine-rich repeat (LRR) protein